MHAESTPAFHTPLFLSSLAPLPAICLLYLSLPFYRIHPLTPLTLIHSFSPSSPPSPPTSYDPDIYALTHFQLELLLSIQLGKLAAPGLALNENPVPSQLRATHVVQRKPGLALPDDTLSSNPVPRRLTQSPTLALPVNLRPRKPL